MTEEGALATLEAEAFSLDWDEVPIRRAAEMRAFSKVFGRQRRIRPGSCRRNLPKKVIDRRRFLARVRAARQALPGSGERKYPGEAA